MWKLLLYFLWKKKALVDYFKLWVNPFFLSSTSSFEDLQLPKRSFLWIIYCRNLLMRAISECKFSCFFKLRLKTSLDLCLLLFPCSRSWCLSLSFSLSVIPCIKKSSSIEGGEVLDIKSSATFYDSELLINVIY